MAIEQIINALVVTSLIGMMLGLGLSVQQKELSKVLGNVPLLSRAFLLNYLVVPTLTVLLIKVFQFKPALTVGMVILAVCPGAPFAPACVRLASGNVTASLGVMLVMAATSALVVPLLLPFLLRQLGANLVSDLDASQILMTLASMQLLPLAIGFVIRHYYAPVANRLDKPINQTGGLLGLAAVALVVVYQGREFTRFTVMEGLGMLVVLISSLGAGWLFGLPASSDRRAMALTTSLKNVGVGLLIATRNFVDPEIVTATLVYGVFEIVGSLIVAAVWSTTSPGAHAIKESQP